MNDDTKGVFNEMFIDTSVKDIIDKYPDLNETLLKANIKIPIKGNMIPQGIATMNDFYLITAYDEKNKSNSICYVLDKKGVLINEVDLNNKSHVGGISYDSINNLIWLPGDNGVLYAYNSEDFLNNKSVYPHYTFDNVSDGLVDFENKKKNLIAFLTIKDNHIFIGNFSKDEESLVKEFTIISNDDEISLKYIRKFKVPAKTQGIAFISKDNKEYMLMSNSYRRKSKSYIYVFTYKNSITNYKVNKAKKISLPPLLEQISISNNKAYVIFESGANKYKDASEIIEFICELSGDKLIES